MKRILLIGASLALGIFAAGQLPAAPKGFGGFNDAARHSAPSQSQPKFNKSFGDAAKSGNVQPFKPFTPSNPIVSKPMGKPFNPIKVNQGFPIKPIKVNDPIVKPFPKPFKPIDNPIVKPWPIKPIKPIKPINPPIVKPWPIKPIDPPDHHVHDKHQHHHHHCEPHWYKPCYSWLWYGKGTAGCYVVSKPVIVEVPIYVNQVEQLPEVQVGATITMPAQALGDQAGVAMLRIADISLGAMVNQWGNNGVQMTLPMVGLEQPRRAEIVVLLPDGQVAMTVPVKLIPAVPPQQQ